MNIKKGKGDRKGDMQERFKKLPTDFDSAKQSSTIKKMTVALIFQFDKPIFK